MSTTEAKPTHNDEIEDLDVIQALLVSISLIVCAVWACAQNGIIRLGLGRNQVVEQ
jgi:hypothetical protein